MNSNLFADGRDDCRFNAFNVTHTNLAKFIVCPAATDENFPCVHPGCTRASGCSAQHRASGRNIFASAVTQLLMLRRPAAWAQTPSTAQIRTAIEVLNKLGERLNERASNSVMQLRESQFGERQAGRIETNTIEQTTRIQSVAAQLESWRTELLQQGRQCVSHHV